MKYRTLGRTGLRVSEIALGCEGFLEKDDAFYKKLFTLALDAGVNCMDMYSPNPDLQKKVGAMLKGRREEFILQCHFCSLWDTKTDQYRATRDPAEVEEAFETLLANLGTDYVDIGMIHYVDSPELWKEIETGPVMAYALKQKELGRARYIGMSSHNPLAARLAVESGLVDVIMFSVNPCYDLQPGNDDIELLFDKGQYAGALINMDPEREALYEACQRRGVGITVMKAFGGGDLLNAEVSPAAAALTPWQCLQYALDRPGVACIMAGVRSEEELKNCLDFESAPEAERDYAAAFASFPRIKWEGHCMYCGHCAPCPRPSGSTTPC